MEGRLKVFAGATGGFARLLPFDRLGADLAVGLLAEADAGNGGERIVECGG